MKKKLGGNLELLTGVGFNGSQAHSPSKISQGGGGDC